MTRTHVSAKIHRMRPYTILDNVGVIFDMDGVLVDSYLAHFESWRLLAAELNQTVTEEQFARTFGRTSRDIIRILFGDARPDDEVRRLDDRKEIFYRDLIRNAVPIMDGAEPLLVRLRRDGARLAVGSSGPPENVGLVIEALASAAKFDAVVTGADVQRGKPDPQVFTLCAERLRIAPERCVVVEDAPAGIEAARRAGMHAVALLSTHHADAFTQADLTIQSLAELTPDDLAALVNAV
jgi:beta-phosphoglucomutase